MVTLATGLVDASFILSRPPYLTLRDDALDLVQKINSIAYHVKNQINILYLPIATPSKSEHCLESYECSAADMTITEPT